MGGHPGPRNDWVLGLPMQRSEKLLARRALRVHLSRRHQWGQLPLLTKANASAFPHLPLGRPLALFLEERLPARARLVRALAHEEDVPPPHLIHLQEGQFGPVQHPVQRVAPPLLERH